MLLWQLKTIKPLDRVFVLLQNRAGKLVKTIKTDHGTEFVNNEFQNYCKMYGIDHVLSEPYCPQTNGKIENHNKILKNGMRVLLNDGNVPLQFWMYFNFVNNRIFNQHYWY